MKSYPQINYIQCNNVNESYRMYYTSWGVQENTDKTIICLHGLNRNSRDFDYIADYFVHKGYFVICPDIVGRGNSDYLKDPMQYIVPNYCKDILQLIGVLNLKNINCLGVSMGGIIAMGLIKYSSNIFNSLVLVDIGAKIELAGIQRIASYTVKNNKFQTFKEIASYIKSTSLDFGDLPDEVWESLALNNSIRANDGMYYVKRDVNLSIPFTDPQNAEQALNLQAEWDAVNIPTLIIRGANSDILSKATLTQMLAKGAFVEAVEIANAGHSPFLYSSQHIQILCDFWGKRA